jgi:hypothetical protein
VTQARTEFSSVTSSGPAVPGSAAPSAWMSSSVADAAAASMSPPATMAPSAANRRAATRPMPRPVPDSSTTLPSSAPISERPGTG